MIRRRVSMLVVIPLIALGFFLGIGAGVGGAYYRTRVRRAYYRVFPGRGSRNLPALVKRGELVFNGTCGSGYCHGPQGRGGGAPMLVKQGIDQVYITNAVSGGVPGTAMAGFAKDMSRSDLVAVVAYVANLNGISYVASDSLPDAPAEREMTGNVAAGRQLFSDALRSFGRCSTCHEAAGTGIPVTGRLAHIPGSVEALRSLATPGVSTVTWQEESMPALVVSQTGREVAFYDLTSPPPVLRTEDAGSVRIAVGSLWKHSATMAGYSDSELGSILSFLRARQP